MSKFNRIISKYDCRYSLWQVINHARKLYNTAPPLLGWIAFPLVYCIKIYLQLRLKLWMVSSNEQRCREPLSILYATNVWNTNNVLDMNYLNGLAYSGDFKVSYIGRAWLWKIPKVIKENAKDYSMAIVQVHEYYRKLLRSKDWFFIPFRVLGEVDIPIAPKVLKKETLRSDLRKIQKHSLRFEVTRDPHKFDDFYHNMYVPHVTKAHGDGAYIVPYEKKKAKFRNCDLLLVMNQEKCIAGILLAFDKGGSRLWSLGIRDGNLEYVKMGAVTALFHFSMLYLEDKGFTKVNLGLSRAFLRDGVLQYKRKWSQKIAGTSRDWFALKILSYQGAAGAFLQKNPFIFEDRGTLNGAVFVDAERPLSAKKFRNIEKLYYTSGLSKLFIYHFQHSNVIKQDNIPPELSERIVCCSVNDPI